MTNPKPRNDGDPGKGHPCTIWAGLIALAAIAIIALPVVAIGWLT
jgi:hypothetical protein